MAPLTWRNVDAPDFRGVADMYSGVSRNWDRAFSNLGDTFQGMRDSQVRSRSAAALPVLAQVANEQGVDAAIRKVSGMVAPGDMSEELQKAMLNLRGTALDYDKSRAGTQIALNQDGRAQTTHERGIMAEDQLGAAARGIVARGEDAYYGKVSPEFAKVQPGIFAGESGGDYDALFGFSNRPGGRFPQVKLTEMTVDQALEFANPSGEYGQWVKGKNNDTVSTPMGAYQVVGTTLRDAKKGLGLTGNEKMTPALQDKIGEWIYQTQGTGAWEGYKGSPQQVDARIADLIPEGNIVSPQTWLGLSADVYEKGRTGLENRRADRDVAIGEEADRLIQETIASTPTPGEVPQAIAESGAPPELVRASLARLQNYPTEALMQPKYNPAPTGSAEAAQAEIAATQYLDEQRAVQANNPTIRIQQRAADSYSDTSAAMQLSKKLGLQGVDNWDSTITRMIDDLSGRKGVSPSVAASVFEDSVRRGGWLPGAILDGDMAKNYLSMEEAEKTIDRYLTPEAIRAGSEMRTMSQQNIATAESMMKQLASNIERGRQLDRVGADRSKIDAANVKLQESIKSLYQARPIVGRPPSVEEAANPMSSLKESAENNAAASALNKAAGKIQEGDGNMSFEEAAQVVGPLIGMSPQQIAALRPSDRARKAKEAREIISRQSTSEETKRFMLEQVKVALGSE